MAERKKDRPGVMLYFDSVRPALNRLDDTQCGRLFRAVVDYAEYGVIPELDPLVGMVFDLLVPKIDRDAERYEESREQRQYAVYCREKQKAGEPCMKIAEWRLSRYQHPDNDSNGPISPDIGKNGSCPSTSISTTPSVSPSTTPSASISSSANTTGKGEAEGYKGDGEGKPTPAMLQAEWKEARRNGENEKALALVNALFRQGYNIDFGTGELSRR